MIISSSRARYFNLMANIGSRCSFASVSRKFLAKYIICVDRIAAMRLLWLSRATDILFAEFLLLEKVAWENYISKFQVQTHAHHVILQWPYLTGTQD